MTIDYRRMNWQHRANKIAEAVRIWCCWVLLPPEILYGIYTAFPFSNRVLLVLTAVAWLLASFVDRHTRMWRYDL